LIRIENIVTEKNQIVILVEEKKMVTVITVVDIVVKMGKTARMGKMAQSAQ
jgi:hypothetical protein